MKFQIFLGMPDIDMLVKLMFLGGKLDARAEPM